MKHFGSIPRGLRILLYIHLGLLVGGFGLYFLNIFMRSRGLSEIFSCGFSGMTHLYCPGCGGTRALSSLMRFDLVSAFRYNANVPVWALTLLYVDLRTVILTVKKGKDQTVPYFSWLLFYNLMAVILAVFFLRNILLAFWGIDFLGEHAAFWQERALFL